jgi:membrane associated rhomboid family serine protease
MDRVTVRIIRILETEPTNNMRIYQRRLTAHLSPLSLRLRGFSRRTGQIPGAEKAMEQFSRLSNRGVTGLIGMNIAAYVLLNSRYMKSRSHVDGLPRSDRHFIASRYNLSHLRLWCIPLSVFNHGDSLMQLMMNCFGLAIVGPAVELAFGPAILVCGFMFTGMLGAIAEVSLGNHWCRGSSGGVTGLLGISSFANPHQILSLWGVMDVRAASLAISIFAFESLVGLLGSSRSEMAHISHATGIAASIPFLYYLRWFIRRF